MSNKADAVNEAIAMALEKLGYINIPAEKTGIMRVFNQEMFLDPHTYSLKTADGQASKPADHLLLLHYLLYDLPIKATQELISFRDFTGGQFYFQPFVSRTTDPVVGRFHNNLDSLKHNLDRFDWEEVKLGDFAAKIKTFSDFDLTLVYHLGDEEFPPAAEILFDSCVKRVFVAEDAAVLASRICIGLL